MFVANPVVDRTTIQELDKAALLRDQMKELKRALDDSQPAGETKAPATRPVSYPKGGARKRGSRA